MLEARIGNICRLSRGTRDRGIIHDGEGKYPSNDLFAVSSLLAAEQGVQFAQHFCDRLFGQRINAFHLPRTPIKTLDLVRQDHPRDVKAHGNNNFERVAFLLIRDWTQNG